MLPRYQALPTSPLSSSATEKSPKKYNLSLFSGRWATRWLFAALAAAVVVFLGLPILRDLNWEWGFPWSQSTVPLHLQGYTRPSSIRLPTEEEQAFWDLRKDEVRDAFQHAWTGYRSVAFPNDELTPVMGGKSNKFNGWGVTLFDSLDTLWMMGLEDEFSSAVETVKDWKFEEIKPDQFVPFFETTIRYLGGLLSAYALSGNEILLNLADDVGRILIKAFNEATSCQLEFKYLAKLTGKREYYDKVQAVMEIFYNASNATNGLFVDQWFGSTGLPSGNHITVGGGSDSGYEYFLKQWVMSGDEKARTQYLTSINSIIDNLIYVTPNGTRGLMYVTDTDTYMTAHRQEHLSCFLPGLLALGAALLDLPPDVREKHEWAASGLTYTCYIAYADQQSGLAPEEIRMNGPGVKWVDELRRWEQGGRQGKAPGMGEPPAYKNWELREYANGWPSVYLLRPETIESIFYMWRTTGDVKWRERGYEIFRAISTRTRTKFGFSSVVGVDKRLRLLDEMPSYFLAETLKYFYLLFDEIDTYPMDRWVFNTEAHPLPTFSWTSDEREAFNITL
ncbi:Endoplasmic reticulum mannosyl-oligosaccharide 1,2-alpha-mannosidase [Psilocybe cubensis]|nr:Endoplasmic reticulum mannosyl-oligosaccharide 1,2-alpha-mannosidase [Psilocybe cubensis]KAH9475723.1 Endoplasmic reticulum mannosyl-oligosaccharide 1,2-alpha-mannosidase [Psilocybe cubensis]